MTLPQPVGDAPGFVSRPPAVPVGPGQGAPASAPSASDASHASPAASPTDAAQAAPGPASGFAPDVHAYITRQQQNHAEEVTQLRSKLEDAERWKSQFMAMAQKPTYARAVLDFLDGKPAPSGAAPSQVPPNVPGAQSPQSLVPQDVDPELAQYIQGQLQNQIGSAVSGLKNEIVDAFRPFQNKINTLGWKQELGQLAERHPDVGEHVPKMQEILAKHPTLDLQAAYELASIQTAKDLAFNRGKEEGLRTGAIAAMQPTIGTAEPPSRPGMTNEMQRSIASAMKQGNTYEATAVALQAALKELEAG